MKLLSAFIVILTVVAVQGQTTVREVVNVTSNPTGTSCARNRLYKNTVNNTLWQRNSVSGQCEQIEGGGGGGAPTDATYITQTANGSLSAEQALSALSSGIMRVATTTGVITSLTNSGGIAANVSDETGSGALVFGTSPNITTPTGIVKGDVGLSNVDNTSDADKPVSSAQQTALNLKANLASPTFTGTVVIPTPFTLGAVSVTPTGTELNFVDGVTSAIQTQIDGKQGTLTNSAGLAAALNDETGTGVAVFGTSPSFTTTIQTPAIGVNVANATAGSVLIKSTSADYAEKPLKVTDSSNNSAFTVTGDRRLFVGADTGANSHLTVTKPSGGTLDNLLSLRDINVTGSPTLNIYGGSNKIALARAESSGVLTFGSSAVNDEQISLNVATGVTTFSGNIVAPYAQVGRNVSAKTSAYPVVAGDVNAFFTNTGAGAGVTFTLPTPVVGMTYEFYRDANQTVTIDIAAGVTIRVGASVTTDGGNATLDAVGSRLRIVAISTTQWVGDISGTVTFN